MSFKCDCVKKPLIFYYGDAEENFYKHLEKVDSSGWFELYKCKTSDLYWRIDIWDKGQERFVIKMEDTDGWEVFDATSLIKKLIITNRGGTTDEDCIWSSCKNKRVKGVVYCIEHLYESGARR